MDNKILTIVNNALYFDDSSDYWTALLEVLAELKPEWFGEDGCLINELSFIEE